MNPFIFDPKKLTTVSGAQYVLSLYDKEISLAITQTQSIEENFNAILDVLKQKYPDISESLDTLSENARYLGHAECSRQDLDTLKSQFVSALPWSVKKSV